MLKVDAYSSKNAVVFGARKYSTPVRGDVAVNEKKREQEQSILNSVQALLLYSRTINDKTEQMLGQLASIAAKGYPAAELRDLEYKARIAAQNVPAPVYFPNHPLSIWGDLYLDLQDNMKLPETAKGLMSRDIANILSGDTKMKDMTNPTVWSISYEYTNPTGGQTDIAREQPVAMAKAGVRTIAVAPMHEITVGNKKINFLKKENGELYYYTPNNRTKVTKIYEGDLKTADRVDKFSIYYGEFGPDRQPTLFLYDNDMFNFKRTDSANVYQDLPHSPERVRMAQFNNMAYEAIATAAEGGLKLPNGKKVRKPDKLIAHEAWQSAGLLGKMRFYSRAEDSIHSRSLKVTDYLRSLADNTAVVIHNSGDAYQGQSWDRGVMEGYFNVLYNDFARDIVENSCIADVGNKKFNLFGTPSQRIGFYADVMNPAHASSTLATTIGAVSEGYKSEIVNNGISSKLDTVMKIRNENGGLTAFPNGVDKKPLAATKENVEKLNLSLETNVVPYIDTTKDDIEELSIKEFTDKKKHNKSEFIKLLKNAVQNNGKPNHLIHDMQSPDFYEGSWGLNLNNINAKTPIFSMASRLDDQKGFNTMIDAYAKLVQNMDENSSDFPVLIISGGGNEGLANYIKYVKDNLGPKGTKILFTEQRLSNAGLLLANMTTRNCMPSDFEPYGISELKGLYAGSHVIANEVGGMKSEGTISRKIYSLDDFGPDKANAVTVKNYEFMCLAPDNEKEAMRDRNSTKLMQAMQKDLALSEKDSYQMDLNALKTDVSWNKGAIQNYLDVMKIHVK